MKSAVVLAVLIGITPAAWANVTVISPTECRADEGSDCHVSLTPIKGQSRHYLAEGFYSTKGLLPFDGAFLQLVAGRDQSYVYINSLIKSEADRFSYLLEDLEGDGSDEVIVMGYSGAHSSYIRVYKLMPFSAELIFEQFSNTPNVDFSRIKGRPTIFVEQSDYAPSYVNGRRITYKYYWNGSEFTTTL